MFQKCLLRLARGSVFGRVSCGQPAPALHQVRGKLLLGNALALVWFATVLIAPGYAQDAVKPPARDLVYPTGSRIGLVPPVGFKVNPAIRGFDDKVNQAAILTFEMPPQAYFEVEKSMTAAALKKQGLTLEKREELSLKDGKGVLLVGPQEAEGVKIRKWILIASMPDMTALLTVQVPEPAKDVYSDAAIRDALSTVGLRTAVPIEEELSLLPYRFDDLAGFRVVRVLSGNLALLTDGPLDSMDAVEQPHILVTIGAGGPQDLSSRQNFARNLLFGIAGFKDVKPVNSEMLRLSGQQIHEIVADANDSKSGANLKVVQWIRFGNTAYVQIVAIAPKDGWLQAFPRFRAVRDGLNPK
jgi:hypothetical protein